MILNSSGAMSEKKLNNGFWINPKSNNNYCKYLFHLLKLTGLTVEINNDVKRGILWKVYTLFVIGVCLVNIFNIALYLYCESFTRTTLKNLNLSDVYVPMGIVYVIIANRPINTLFNDIWKTAHTICPKLKFRFWFWFGVISFLLDIFVGCFKFYLSWALLTHRVTVKEKLINVFASYLFASSISNTWANIFCWFVLLNIFLLSESFVGLNNSFNENIHKVEAEDMDISFQRRHLEISELVNRFSDCLSPAIVILTATKMLQIICSIDNLNNLDELPFLNTTYIFFMVRSMVSFVALVESGQRLRNHAGEGINVLLKYNLQRPHVTLITSSYPSNTMYPNSHISVLFASRNVTTPVAINASRMFCVDYTLYLVVISLAVTYTSLVTTLSASSH